MEKLKFTVEYSAKKTLQTQQWSQPHICFFTFRSWTFVTLCHLFLVLWNSAICLSSGDIFVIEPLDYEVSHEYYITIEATDSGSPPLSDMATVNINLTDVNDNQPAFSQDVYTTVISEDTELGKTVITVRYYKMRYLLYSSHSREISVLQQWTESINII